MLKIFCTEQHHKYVKNTNLDFQCFKTYFTCVVVFVLTMMNGLCSGSRDTGDFLTIIAHVLHAIWITCVSSWYSNQLFTVQIKLILIQPAVKKNITLFVICLAFMYLKKEIKWSLCKQRCKKVEGTSLNEIYNPPKELS